MRLAASLSRFPDLAGRTMVCAVVALAPLPFGSVEPLWILLWCALLAVGAALLSARNLKRSHVIAVTPMVTAFGLLLLLTYLQFSPEATWAGSPNPVWHKASELLEMALPQRIAVTAVWPV